MPIFEIEAYNGFGTNIYWDEKASANISICNKVVCVSGNKSCFISLAKQMLYFANNDFCLPYGTHIHYDQAFGRNYSGAEIILEIIPADHQGVILDVNDFLHINVNLPKDIHKLHTCWNDCSRVEISASSDVHILANYHGLLFMATVLLFLAETDAQGQAYLCDERHFHGWSGYDVMFKLVS